MKQLTCEMCGGTDLIKQDGVFVCQSCGMKYSVEDAKKMMIEGTVEVAGTVKVDTTDTTEKNLINARRAIENEDWENVEKYYSLVEQNMPDNIEVTFFCVYGRTMNLLFDTDFFKREQSFNALNKVISTLGEYYNNTDEDKQILIKINASLQKMYATTNFVRYIQMSSGTGSALWQKKLYKSIETTFISELEKINRQYSETYINQIISDYYAKEQKIKDEKAKNENASRREGIGIKVGAVIGGIIGVIIGIWFCNLCMDSIRTPIGRLNNPPQNDWFVMIVAFGAPALLGAFIGALIGGAIAYKKK